MSEMLAGGVGACPLMGRRTGLLANAAHGKQHSRHGTGVWRLETDLALRYREQVASACQPARPARRLGNEDAAHAST